MRLRIGDAFVNTHPASPIHLWIVVAECAEGFVIVNLTSDRPGVDRSCELDVGDHPFVKHKSVIAYSRGQILSF